MFIVFIDEVMMENAGKLDICIEKAFLKDDVLLKMLLLIGPYVEKEKDLTQRSIEMETFEHSRSNGSKKIQKSTRHRKCVGKCSILY
jgi:hypothetical protein